MRPTEDILATLEERGLLELARAIAARHHLTLEEVLSPSRVTPAPEARAALWTELSYLGWSYNRIAQLVGCHHTTIMAAVRQMVMRRTSGGHCGRCGGHHVRPGSDERCPFCNGRDLASDDQARRTA